MRAIERFILILALASTLWAASGCNRDVTAEKEESAVERIGTDRLKLTPDAMRNLTLAKAQEEEFSEMLSLMGRISIPEDRITVVSARVAGRTDGVYVASGEQVAQGQPLASVFSPDFIVAREEYLQALKQRGGLDGTDGQSLTAMAARKLEAMGMSPEDTGRVQETAMAGSGPATHLTIRAPRSGVIIDKKAVVGSLVNAGDTLFTVGDLSKVWFAGDIYPEDLSKIHKSQEVRIEPMGGGEPIQGRISFISPVIDPTTRTIKIRALVDNPGRSLRADMYVKGNVTLSKRMALQIPRQAVVRLRDQSFCFKKLEGDVFQKVQIETVGEQAGKVAVSKGIQGGDTIVSEGALLLEAALTSTEH